MIRIKHMRAGMENKITELEQEKKSKHAEIKMLQSSKDAEMGGEVKVCVRVCECTIPTCCEEHLGHPGFAKDGWLKRV